VLIWLVTHAVIPTYDVATTVSLLIYTVVGIVLYFAGIRNEHHGFRIAGQTLLLLVSGRLLLVDVWEMELASRIVTFFVVGILLIATAFIRKTKKETDHYDAHIQ
jgi:uncharacterized membrane protein